MKNDILTGDGKMIFERANDGMFLLNAGTLELLLCNEASLVMLGYSLDKSEGLEISRILQEDFSHFSKQVSLFRASEASTRFNVKFLKKDGTHFHADISLSKVELGSFRYVMVTFRDVKVLSGMLPICASCKSIRDGKGKWNKVETYFMQHFGFTFTHGLCPDCIKKHFPDIELDREGNII